MNDNLPYFGRESDLYYSLSGINENTEWKRVKWAIDFKFEDSDDGICGNLSIAYCNINDEYFDIINSDGNLAFRLIFREDAEGFVYDESIITGVKILSKGICCREMNDSKYVALKTAKFKAKECVHNSYMPLPNA
ncbi:MAG: hypothetical protein Q8910_00530 [Bacteroidota bacterium]|nr:hypothetical protein [Bacteroidota bacterium]